MAELWEYVVATILSIVAGVLNGTYPIPMKITRKYIRKQTLWQIENNWLFHCIFGLILFPWVTAACAASDNYEKFYEVLKALEWQDIVPPVVLFALWAVLGHFFYGFACDYGGMALASAITFCISASIYPWADLLFFDRINVLQAGIRSIFVAVGTLLTLISFILLTVALFRKRNIQRDKAERQEEMVAKDMIDQTTQTNSKHKVEKVSPRTAFNIGYTMAVISGFFSPILYMYGGTGIRTKASQQGINEWRSLFVIWLISVGCAGSVATFFVVSVLLLSRRTIKKFAITSGGFVFLAGCTNFKWHRLLGIILAFVQSSLWYSSLLLFFIACFLLHKPFYDYDKATWFGSANNANPIAYTYFVFTAVSLVVAQLWSIMLKEWRKKFKKLYLEFTVFIIAIFIILASCVLFGIGSQIEISSGSSTPTNSTNTTTNATALAWY